MAGIHDTFRPAGAANAHSRLVRVRLEHGLGPAEWAGQEFWLWLAIDLRVLFSTLLILH